MSIRKKRSDCFFGLHFDFHATDEFQNIGAYTDAKKVGEYLDAVKPDFIAFDTKGHPGYTSFFSEYGTVAPGLTVDHLKIIREETAKRGILLFSHYSGHTDKRVCEDHPDWAIKRKDGRQDWDFIDFESPYYETIMLPHLKELAGKYGFDGVWVDGDCGFTRANYSDKTMQEFKEKTGFDHVDDDPASESHIAFTKMQRDRFAKELARYVSDMKEEYPNFEIVCSWANSYLMGENAVPTLEYHSDDVAETFLIGANARSYAGLDKPWDLMCYAFPRTWCTPHGTVRTKAIRHIDRINRDGAIIVSLGGMYQVDNMLSPWGELRMAEKEVMTKVSEFFKARQPFCQGLKPTKNAALWCSNDENICACGGDAYHERLLPLLYGDLIVNDGGRPVDVVYDDVILSDKIFEHPAIIIPEVVHIFPKMRDALQKYMEKGGKVIAIGPDACKAFTEVTSDEERQMFFEQDDIYMEGVITKRIVTFPDDMEPLTKCHIEELKFDSPTINAAAWKPVGEGALYCIGWNLIKEYSEHFSFLNRDFLRSVLDKADPKPEAYLEDGIRCAQIIPAVKNGKKFVSVVNMADYQDIINMDISFERNKGAIPPIYDLTVAVKYDQKPDKLWFEPEHKALDFTYDGEYAHVKIPRVDIHGVIVSE